MGQVHRLARTTPRIRAEIRNFAAGVTALAELYNISVATARKWKGRDNVLDRSHWAHDLGTILSLAKEVVMVEIRRLCLLPLNGLVSITHRFIHADASRSGLSRLLRRAGGAKLADLASKDDSEEAPKKTF